jgi:hypothetical protein
LLCFQARQPGIQLQLGLRGILLLLGQLGVQLGLRGILLLLGQLGIQLGLLGQELSLE